MGIPQATISAIENDRVHLGWGARRFYLGHSIVTQVFWSSPARNSPKKLRHKQDYYRNCKKSDRRICPVGRGCITSFSGCKMISFFFR